MLDFRVHTFLIAYRLRSFTRAARELHISQPAVSQHIKHLEAHYQQELFTMRGRSVVPTPAGTLLYEKLHTLANDERRISAELALIGADEGRPLNLGCTRTIADFVAPQLLVTHARRHPAQRLNLRCGNTTELLRQIEDGTLDVALVEGPYDRRAFSGGTLSDEPFIAVADAGAGSGERAEDRTRRDRADSGCCIPARAGTIDDLLRLPLIVREAGSGSREILERNLIAHGLALDSFASVIELGSISVIKEFVRAGFGITFLYRVAVEDELAAGTLREVTPPDMRLHHHFDLVWQRGSIYEPQFSALLDLWRADAGHTAGEPRA